MKRSRSKVPDDDSSGDERHPKHMCVRHAPVYTAEILILKNHFNSVIDTILSGIFNRISVNPNIFVPEDTLRRIAEDGPSAIATMQSWLANLNTSLNGMSADMYQIAELRLRHILMVCELRDNCVTLPCVVYNHLAGAKSISNNMFVGALDALTGEYSYLLSHTDTSFMPRLPRMPYGVSYRQDD